ncbi:hypothetical protein B0T17DRAFT_620423 [Bombardia bombarda]|uniref:RGS domain-containing protein n=1 Tax=Bombardia bombarda TaxID=252184 RepID=A0AA39U7Z2_9PEZI|nr:hypothetical protein B0T17DRAFT_620423 [Bombardia bombarda]
MGLLPLTYRRPQYAEKSELDDSDHISQTSLDDGSETTGKTPDRSVKSSRFGILSGIPAALSFDRIIQGGTCPPCTIRDFMNYLIYIERAAENLQFFLWYYDYIRRFVLANSSDLALAPRWTNAMEDEVAVRIQKDHAENARKEPTTGLVAELFRGTDFEGRAEVPTAPHRDFYAFLAPPPTPEDDDEFDSVSSKTATYRAKAAAAFASAGAKAPFAIQPFRKEIDRVIATYIMDGAPRQLNLSDREQKAVLQALAYTTHPSAFHSIIKLVESALRRQAHPNFIRWSICNGNPARVFFARALGVGTNVFSFLLAVILTLSRAGRGYRALAAIGWVVGIATLIAAYKGMCVVLHGLHHRHVRPWELFLAEENAFDLGRRSFDSFGTSNSYEDEPWVIRYQNRSLIRKIFDRQVWIKEPAMRQIQDTIFVQSILCAVVVSGILTTVFVLMPGGNFF